MDDTNDGYNKRKRENAGGVLSKKQALLAQETNGEQTPFSLETRVHVILEQKRAILNKFEEQKLEISDLSYNLENASTKLSLYESLLGKSFQLWNQMELELETTVSKLGQNLSGPSDRGTLSLSNGDLNGELLDRKKQRLSDLLQTVHSVTDNYHKKRHSALSTLIQDPAIKSTNLAVETEKLQYENSKLTSHLDEISHQYKSLTFKYNEVNSTQQSLKSKIDGYETQLSELKVNFLATSKKLNKLETEASEEAKYIRKSQLEANEQTNASTNNNNNNITNSGSTTNLNISVSPKQENVTGNGTPMEVTEDTKSLQQEISDLKFTLGNRNNQLSQLQEEKLELIKETQKLKEQTSSRNIPEESILGTDLYKRIYDKYQSISYEYEILKSHHDKLRNDFNMQKDNFRKNLEKMGDEDKIRREKLESALKDEQYQVVKCKAEIESLMNKLDIKNSTNPSKLAEELRLIISTRESELKKLKEQCDKFKEDSNKLKTFQEDHKKSTEKIYEQIDFKAHEIKELNSKISQLKNTIDDYIHQKKQWEEKSREFKLLLETYQSQPKDKRDLKEIRLSEKKLQDDILLLKEKLDKLENDPLSVQIKKLEEKHLEDIENLKKEHSIKLFNAEKLLKQSKSSYDAQKQDLDNITSELEMISGVYEELQEQNTRLLEQLGEREDTLTRITSDQIKSTQVHNLLNEEKQILNEKMQKQMKNAQNCKKF